MPSLIICFAKGLYARTSVLSSVHTTVPRMQTWCEMLTRVPPPCHRTLTHTCATYASYSYGRVVPTCVGCIFQVHLPRREPSSSLARTLSVIIAVNRQVESYTRITWRQTTFPARYMNFYRLCGFISYCTLMFYFITRIITLFVIILYFIVLLCSTTALLYYIK